MIELRNDEIENTEQQKEWAGRLAGIFAALRIDRKKAERTALDGLAL